MKEITITEVITKLESLFSKFNESLFDGQLEKPVITVSPDTCNAYGWCTSWKAWKECQSDDGYYEINISADYLNRSFLETCGTLIHEMVHLDNLRLNIKDTSRSGTYHNKKFKEAAEAHGLIVEKTKSGWSKTSLSDGLRNMIENLNEEGFKLYRSEPEKSSSKKSSMRKYVCPDCGMIIRATKEVRVICADCEYEMIEE